MTDVARATADLMPAGGVAAIVLAAGRATRMGVQKLLLPVRGRPMVRWAVDAAAASKAERTIVVLGHEAGAVRAALEGSDVTITVNHDYRAGMSSSLQAGLRAAGDSCAAAIVLLGDQPYVTATLLDGLIDRFAATGASVVRPAVAGRPANPVLLSSVLFPELLRQRGDVGGREVVERHAGEVSLVRVDDQRVCIDIDSPQDYEAAREST
jgi:molybdenum cofactor cytidylyltransferase